RPERSRPEARHGQGPGRAVPGLPGCLAGGGGPDVLPAVPGRSGGGAGAAPGRRGEPAPSGRAVEARAVAGAAGGDAGGAGAEARRQAAALAGPPEDPQTVQGRLTLLEAQATKLKATIQRRKQLRDGPAILGHYERVLAALEGEIASLGGAAAARTAAS
ncbi:unnamed protein product, partial [Prorocentrum cordatum]